MDTTPGMSSMDQASYSPQKNKNPWLFISMEIGFVVSILVIIFGILVFLNVIKLSSLISLVHLSSSPTSKYAPTPTPFIYDSTLAEKTLSDYIHATINQSSLPPQLSIIQKQSGTGKTNGSAYSYSALWKTSQASISAYFNYNVNSNTPSDLDIAILSGSTDAIPSALQKYFHVLQNVSLKCADANGIHTCEYFSTQKDKTKVGIGGAIQNGQLYIFSCKILTKSTHYSWKSCIEQYKDTGI